MREVEDVIARDHKSWVAPLDALRAPAVARMVDEPVTRRAEKALQTRADQLQERLCACLEETRFSTLNTDAFKSEFKIQVTEVLARKMGLGVPDLSNIKLFMGKDRDRAKALNARCSQVTIRAESWLVEGIRLLAEAGSRLALEELQLAASHEEARRTAKKEWIRSEIQEDHDRRKRLRQLKDLIAGLEDLSAKLSNLHESGEVSS